MRTLPIAEVSPAKGDPERGGQGGRVADRDRLQRPRRRRPRVRRHDRGAPAARRAVPGRRRAPAASTALEPGDIGTIVVGYDGSVEAKAALVGARTIARVRGARLRLVEVLDATWMGTPALMQGPGYILTPDDAEARARDYLTETASTLAARRADRARRRRRRARAGPRGRVEVRRPGRRGLARVRPAPRGPARKRVRPPRARVGLPGARGAARDRGAARGALPRAETTVDRRIRRHVPAGHAAAESPGPRAAPSPCHPIAAPTCSSPSPPGTAPPAAWPSGSPHDSTRAASRSRSTRSRTSARSRRVARSSSAARCTTRAGRPSSTTSSSATMRSFARRRTWLFSVGTFGDRRRVIGPLMRREPRNIAQVRETMRPRRVPRLRGRDPA